MLRLDAYWNYPKRRLLRPIESVSSRSHHSTFLLVALALVRHGTKLWCQDADFDLWGIYYLLLYTHRVRLDDSAQQKLFQHFLGNQSSYLVGLRAYLPNVLLPLQELKIDCQSQISPHDRLADVNRKLRYE